MRTERIQQLVQHLDQIDTCVQSAKEHASKVRSLIMGDIAERGVHDQRISQRLPRHEVADDSHYPIADRSTFGIRWHGKFCRLGDTLPFRLLHRLLLSPNRFVSYEQLMEDVWDGVKADETIRSVVRHLKHRLKNAEMGDLADAISGRNHHYAVLLDPRA